MRDYVGIAKDYAQEAIDDVNQDKFNHWVRQAARRFFDDLERAEADNAPFYFDEFLAEDPCGFIEKLPHVEGRWKDKDGNYVDEIILHESHIFLLVNLFGFRNHNGTRRFTTALLAIARKNAKSTLAAAILLYCLCCEEELGAQVISAATTGKQAHIIFKIAKQMVEKSPDLREAFNLETFANAITNWEQASNFSPIAAKASTQDGLNPSHIGLDEIHAHKSADLINVLESAAGARENPLWLYTTTEGYENSGPWSEIRHFAKQVLNGTVEADHYFALIYSLDDQVGKKGEKDYRPADDDFDSSKWIKANPLMEVNPLLRIAIEKAALEAQQMPLKHSEFKIKRLNRPSSVANGWINLTKWRECSGEVDLKWLEKYDCYGGLDLSFTNDLASFRLVWDINGRFYTYGWRFAPKTSVETRTRKGLVPFNVWVESKHLIEAGDEIIDYDVVFDTIMQAMRTFKIKMIGYDDWNVKQILKKLQDKNVPMSEFRQGGKSYHPAMKLLEERYVVGKLNHGGDPILNWNAANIVARTDQNMNNAPDKRKSFEKIDDMVALLMAIGTSIDTVVKPSIDSWLNS